MVPLPGHEKERVIVTVPELFLLIYILLNAGAFVIFGRDKFRARSNAWRTPESLLLAIALLGPFGAYGAMLFFRHKTRKVKFFLVPLFLILHAGIIIWLASSIFP